jgi:hypothetical protein
MQSRSPFRYDDEINTLEGCGATFRAEYTVILHVDTDVAYLVLKCGWFCMLGISVGKLCEVSSLTCRLFRVFGAAGTFSGSLVLV